VKLTSTSHAYCTALLLYSRNRLGPETALALSEALPRNDTLKTLRIGWNALGAVGSIAIARALGCNTAIEVPA
jgi:hypothetical protein